jgi:hypothetical protein
LSSLLCNLSIQPFSSRRDLRRRTRPAVIVTSAQPDCDIPVEQAAKQRQQYHHLFFPATPHCDKEIN